MAAKSLDAVPQQRPAAQNLILLGEFAAMPAARARRDDQGGDRHSAEAAKDGTLKKPGDSCSDFVQITPMPNNIAFPFRPRGEPGRAALDPARILEALPQAIIAVDSAFAIRYVNTKAEEFFYVSAATLLHAELSELIPADSPVFSLIRQVLRTAAPIADHGLTLQGRRIGKRDVVIQATPLGDPPELAVVAFQERSIADRLDQQWSQRGAVQSARAMAAMLAHEVRNPLSGIRGAAQLLEQGANAQDRELTRIICDETDRIKALVDRMEVFSDDVPLEREAVNIHTVLNQVRRVAAASYAGHVAFVERYDPSLPSVLGNREQLVRLFTNLVKNAAEAITGESGDIILSTAYQSGLRLSSPNGDGRAHLPLVVSVEDNGDGVSDSIRPHIFDAFVSGKQSGTGLGLALVAKIVGEHGGLIELENLPGRTIFRVFLPMAERSIS
jgi:two-component system nitrogen regulation sensor histidine kinase GlnL